MKQDCHTQVMETFAANLKDKHVRHCPWHNIACSAQLAAYPALPGTVTQCRHSVCLCVSLLHWRLFALQPAPFNSMSPWVQCAAHGGCKQPDDCDYLLRRNSLTDRSASGRVHHRLIAGNVWHAAPAVTEAFAQRCSALAVLDSLPPIAPDAVRSLAASHGAQLRALLADGPAAADPKAIAQGKTAGSGSAAAAQQAASSLDWQVAAASRRSPAGTRHGAGPASAAVSPLGEHADAAPVQASGQAGSQLQGPQPSGAGGDILDSLEV